MSKDYFNEVCRLIGKHSSEACDAVGMVLNTDQQNQLVYDLQKLFGDKKRKKDEMSKERTLDDLPFGVFWFFLSEYLKKYDTTRYAADSQEYKDFVKAYKEKKKNEDQK